MTSKKALQIIWNCYDAEAYETYYDGAKNVHEEELKIIEKDLDTLKIIKDKKVDVPYIIENPEEKDVIWYNSKFMGVVCEGWRMLSQTEYDLLREVLLNENK